MNTYSQNVYQFVRSAQRIRVSAIPATNKQLRVCSMKRVWIWCACLAVSFWLWFPVHAIAQGWTPVYNDGCDGEGHRVLVGEITSRATLGDGCDVVAGFVAPDQRYAGEWVWGYSPTAGAVRHASADDAAYYRPHICSLLPRFPFAPSSQWGVHRVAPREYLYDLYGADYPAYIAASCRMREQDDRFARIGLDRALVPGSFLAEPPPEQVRFYLDTVLNRERVALDVPTGRLTMVFPGDSLGRLARIFGTTVEALQTANNMRDPNALLVGQLLLIPGHTATPATATPIQPPWCTSPLIQHWKATRTLCTWFQTNFSQ